MPSVLHTTHEADVRDVAAAALSGRLASLLAREVPGTDLLARSLKAYLGAPYIDGAPATDVRVSNTPTVLKLLGRSAGQFVADYADLTNAANRWWEAGDRTSLARYPDDVLDAFFPGGLSAVERLILDGPLRGAQSIENTLEALARVPKNPAVRLSDPDSMAEGTFAHLSGHFRAVVAKLVESNDRLGDASPEALRAWKAVPRWGLPANLAASAQIEAVPLEEVRLSLAQHTNDVRALMSGADSFDAELRWAQAASPDEIRRAWPLLLSRFLVLLFAVGGGRVREILKFRIESFVDEYHGPAPDHAELAALIAEPGKSKHAKGKKRPKGCSDGMALMVRTLITVRRRLWQAALDGEVLYARHDGKTRKTDPIGAIRAGGHGLPDTAALLPVAWWLTGPVDYRAILRRFMGVVPRSLVVRAPDDPKGRWSAPRESGARRPLIRRRGYRPGPAVVAHYAAVWNTNLPEGVPPLTDEEVADIIAEFTGYQPHQFRHLTFQLAVKAGVFYNQDNLAPPGQKHPEPSLYGHAYVDHTVKDSREVNELEHIYGDLGTENAYALIGLRVGPMLWDMVMGDLGARKVQDIELAMEVAAELEMQEADIAALPGRAEELELRSSELANRPASVKRPSRVTVPEALTVHAKLDLALRLLHRVTEQNDALFDQNVELRGLMQEMHEVSARQHHLVLDAWAMSLRQKDLAVELQDLLVNPDRFRRVPDDETLSAADQRQLKIGELRALLATNQPALPAATWIRPDGGWLTLQELAELVQRDFSVVSSRWVKGTNMPRRAEDRPWDPDAARTGAIPVELAEWTDDDGVVHAARYRRVWLAPIPEAFWQARGEKVQERLAELQTHWPKAQGWSDRDGNPSDRSLAPLRLPEPYASQYAAACAGGHHAEIVAAGEIVDD